MFLDVVSKLLVVCGEGDLLVDMHGAVGRGGFACLYMFHRYMY